MNQTILMCCITALIFSSCNEENFQKQEQPVQFSFGSDDLSEQGKIADADVRAIVISVKNASGEHVFEMKKVALYKMEDQFISEPVSLKEGDYQLTHFMAVDENDKVVYISPKEGSERAHLVNDPLPIAFSVIENETSQVPVAVLRVEDAPEAYGYVSYTLEVQNTVAFRVKAFELEIPGFAQYEEPVLVLTNAHIEVYLRSPEEGNKIFEGTITPTDDIFEIKEGHPDVPIHIKVTKQHYHPYGETFTLAELEAFFDNPLEVVLERVNPFHLVIKSHGFIGLILVPSGAPNKLLNGTSEGLFKIDVSDLENPGDPVLVLNQLPGHVYEDLHGNLFANDYMSSDQGETWQPRTIPEDALQHNFVDFNGVHYALKNNELLYRETSIGQWEFVSKLPYRGKLIVYDNKLFAANGLLVSTDGENFTETGFDFDESGGESYFMTGIFTAIGNLYMIARYGSDQGFFFQWTGDGWNAVYDYDAGFETNNLAGEYEDYMVLFELNSLKIFKNCSENDCEPIYSWFVRWKPDQMPPTTISGRLISGKHVFIQGFDDDGFRYLWGADLSKLDL